MGNITLGAARGYAAPSSSLALLPRIPAFVSTGVPPPACGHRKSSAGSTSSTSSISSSSSTSTSTSRTFPSRKRPHPVPVWGRSSLSRAVKPEAAPSGPAHSHSLRPNDDNGGGGGGGGGDDAVAQATLRWVRSTVVGLNLCPWAGGALVGGRMQVLVHPTLPGKPVLCSMADAPTTGASDVTSSSGGAGASATEESAERVDSSYISGSQPGSGQKEPEQRESSGTIRPSGGGIGGTPRDTGEEDAEGLLSPLDGLVEVAAQQARALAALKGDAAVNATTLVVARPPVAEDFDEFLEVVDAVDDFLDRAGLRGTVQLATFHPGYRFEGSEEDDASNYTNRSPYPVLHLLLEEQVSAAVAQIGDPAKVWQRNVETTRELGVEAMRRGVEACLTAGMPMGKGTRRGGEGDRGQR